VKYRGCPKTKGVRKHGVITVLPFYSSDTTTFLRQYNQQRSVTSALSQLELDAMEQHLKVELRRQDNEAVARKHDCYTVIRSVIEDVEKVCSFNGIMDYFWFIWSLN